MNMNMHSIIVLGRGFLGKEFERHGFKVWDKTKFNLTPDDHSDLKKINSYDVIINCIAKSNTRWCEDSKNFNNALFVNGIIPKILSEKCKSEHKKFIHISTGCLYDDTTKDNKEDDLIASHCNYTVTKWVGEKYCNKNDIILRPRLLFSDIPDKNNLLCKLPNYKSYVNNYKDSLTRTKTIVNTCITLLEENASGIFNVAEDGPCTIADIVMWCNNFGKPKSTDWIHLTTMEHVRNIQKLYLVNNTMDISKIKKYLKINRIKDSIQECYKRLCNETSHI
jgi:dTDP-4-dehydrorhamnose reductase